MVCCMVRIDDLGMAGRPDYIARLKLGDPSRCAMHGALATRDLFQYDDVGWVVFQTTRCLS